MAVIPLISQSTSEIASSFTNHVQAMAIKNIVLDKDSLVQGGSSATVWCSLLRREEREKMLKHFFSYCDDLLILCILNLIIRVVRDMVLYHASSAKRYVASFNNNPEVPKHLIRPAAVYRKALSEFKNDIYVKVD